MYPAYLWNFRHRRLFQHRLFFAARHFVLGKGSSEIPHFAGLAETVYVAAVVCDKHNTRGNFLLHIWGFGWSIDYDCIHNYSYQLAVAYIATDAGVWSGDETRVWFNIIIGLADNGGVVLSCIY